MNITKAQIDAALTDINSSWASAPLSYPLADCNTCTLASLDVAGCPDDATYAIYNQQDLDCALGHDDGTADPGAAATAPLVRSMHLQWGGDADLIEAALTRHGLRVARPEGRHKKFQVLPLSLAVSA